MLYNDEELPDILHEILDSTKEKSLVSIIEKLVETGDTKTLLRGLGRVNKAVDTLQAKKFLESARTMRGAFTAALTHARKGIK